MTPQEAIAKHGLTMTAEFVPFSKSRNAKHSPKFNDLSLNWRVTLCLPDGIGKLGASRPFLTTDYQAGLGHCPSYEQGRVTIHIDEAVRYECETGRSRELPLGKTILPKIEDVFRGLLLDGDAIDYPTYEDWADSFGYDQDSRKGEAIYRACLEIGLKLRAGLGDAALADLREAFQDY